MNKYRLPIIFWLITAVIALVSAGWRSYSRVTTLRAELRVLRDQLGIKGQDRYILRSLDIPRYPPPNPRPEANHLWLLRTEDFANYDVAIFVIQGEQKRKYVFSLSSFDTIISAQKTVQGLLLTITPLGDHSKFKTVVAGPVKGYVDIPAFLVTNSSIDDQSILNIFYEYKSNTSLGFEGLGYGGQSMDYVKSICEQRGLACIALFLSKRGGNGDTQKP